MDTPYATPYGRWGLSQTGRLRQAARLRGSAASGPAGGVVRHGIAYARPGEGCVCARHDCGGMVPVSWCAEHGDAVAPTLEWHPGGGIRCTDLSAAQAAAVGQTARTTVD